MLRVKEVVDLGAETIKTGEYEFAIEWPAALGQPIYWQAGLPVSLLEIGIHYLTGKIKEVSIVSARYVVDWPPEYPDITALNLPTKLGAPVFEVHDSWVSNPDVMSFDSQDWFLIRIGHDRVSIEFDGRDQVSTCIRSGSISFGTDQNGFLRIIEVDNLSIDQMKALRDHLSLTSDRSAPERNPFNFRAIRRRLMYIHRYRIESGEVLMGYAEATVTVNAPLEAVWNALNDIDHTPEWVVGLKDAEVKTPGPYGVGTEYIDTNRLGPFPQKTLWRITTFEPMSKQVHKSESRVLPSTMTLKLWNAPQGTHVQMVVEYRFLPILGPFGGFLENLVMNRILSGVLKQNLGRLNDYLLNRQKNDHI